MFHLHTLDSIIIQCQTQKKPTQTSTKCCTICRFHHDDFPYPPHQNSFSFSRRLRFYLSLFTGKHRKHSLHEPTRPSARRSLACLSRPPFVLFRRLPLKFTNLILCQRNYFFFISPHEFRFSLSGIRCALEKQRKVDILSRNLQRQVGTQKLISRRAWWNAKLKRRKSSLNAKLAHFIPENRLVDFKLFSASDFNFELNFQSAVDLFKLLQGLREEIRFSSCLSRKQASIPARTIRICLFFQLLVTCLFWR